MTDNHIVRANANGLELAKLSYTYDVVFPTRPLLTDGSSQEVPCVAGGLYEDYQDADWAPSVKKADKLDYAVAACSGILAGILDSFFVGEFSLDRAEKWGSNQVEKFIRGVAKFDDGYENKELEKVIAHLEEHHHMAADGAANDFGGGFGHHIRDFSHHFGIDGILFSIFTQFSGLIVGTNTEGNLLVVPVPESHRKYIGKNVPEKLLFGTVEWFFHMASDMAGSKGSLMGGTGIPGPIVSLIKDYSALPFFRDAEKGGDGLRIWVAKLFNGTMFRRVDEKGKVERIKFDLRTEIGIYGELGRMALPVLLNQCFVRSFYFIRSMYTEMKDLKVSSVSDLKKIAPEDVLPFHNARVLRMVTVSSGVFEAVDISDALIRAAIIAGKDKGKFFGEFIVRVNFVGVGTFAIACAMDVKQVLASKKQQTAIDPAEAMDKELSDLGCLTLDAEQVRLLHSLQLAIVLGDIVESPKAKRNARKKKWVEEWQLSLLESLGMSTNDAEGYFLNPPELYARFNEAASEPNGAAWPYLVALEGLCFEPYYPLYSGHDDEYKGLKDDCRYMETVFCKMQAAVDKDDINALSKALSKSKDQLNMAGTKRVVGAVGTVVLVAATGGVAFAFAPAVAPVIAAAIGGEAVAGLSGAALTSASLALLGGGALAAGGAGMAGGAAVIAGGGALLGAVGGSGVSAVTAMALSSDGYVFEESAKLLAYCKEVLIGRMHDIASVANIQAMLNVRIVELDIQIESLKRGDDDMMLLEDGKKQSKKTSEQLSPKKVAKILAKSRGCLERCNEELGKAIVAERKRQEKEA